MRIGITGGTGFIGRYIVNRLAKNGHECVCWYRPESNRSGLPKGIAWIPGDLTNGLSMEQLVAGCDAIIHSALHRPDGGSGFRGAEGDIPTFVEANLLGTIRLVEAAKQANVSKFIFLSTCAVHEEILDDRPLDETHPLWPKTHYGAHKAAIEKFVHSYGFGDGYDICSLRPSGVYGLRDPREASKWFDIILKVKNGEPVNCRRGGKEVHASDVAKACEVLLNSKNVMGQAFSCCDRYVSEFDVATIAKELSGSDSEIIGGQKTPKHNIETGKLESLGMEFGGERLLRGTIKNLLEN